MPRGKNYVNQGKGVSLQASSKSKARQMVVCQYGTACARPDCIYRHPYGKGGVASSAGGSAAKQSREPCMAYLAGICTFSATGCRKRHPPPLECQRLIDKYSKVKCRFGDDCLTNGCLYMHPGDEEYDDGSSRTYAQEPTYLSPQDMHSAFPPLGATAVAATFSNETVLGGGAVAPTNNVAMTASTPSWAPATATAADANASTTAAPVAAGSWKPSAPGIPSNAAARAMQSSYTYGRQQQQQQQQQQYYGQGYQYQNGGEGEGGSEAIMQTGSSFSANAPEFRPPGQR